MSINTASRPKFEDMPLNEQLGMHPEVVHGHKESLHDKALEQLGSLSITEAIDADWKAAEELAQHMRIGYARRQIDRWGGYTPVIAEAIVDEVAFVSPSAAQIKEENFLLKVTSNILGFFSSEWGERFDNYLVRTARRRIVRVAQRITAPLDAIAGVKAPKAQFLQEIEDMYRNLQGQDDTDTTDGPQKRLPALVRQMREPKPARASGEDSWHARYPMLSKLLPSLGLPSLELAEHKRTIKAVSPEVMRGIEQFLRKHGTEVKTLEPAAFGSLTRKLIQRFAPQKLSHLPSRVETVLTQAYNILPEDGQKFSQSVYDLCKKVVALSHEGVDGKTLSRALLRNLRLK